MDLATLIGLIGSFIVVAIAMILGGGLAPFIDAPSMVVVFGGTLFVVLMKFTLSQFLGAIGVAAKSFKFKSVEPAGLIEEIVGLAEEARKGGLLSLEGKETSHDFLGMGVSLMIDGHDPEVVSALLSKEKNMAVDRHVWGAKIFEAIADVAPAMGMIGTLVGLVLMLGNMSDPKSIGPSMAVALLTTLYGAMLANMVAMPIANKLELRRVEEQNMQSMIIDGVSSIQAGQNPRVIRAMLLAYIHEGKRPVEEEEEA